MEWFLLSFHSGGESGSSYQKGGLSPDEAVLWESDGQTGFSIQGAKKESRGTEVTLHLRSATNIDGEKSHDDLLSHWKLSEIISKYSDHIAIPIKMKKQQWDEKKSAYKELETWGTGE